LSDVQKKVKKLVKENMKELYTYFRRNKNKSSTDKLKKVLNYFVELDYYLNLAEEESKKILNDSMNSKNLDEAMIKNGNKLMSNERSYYHDSDNMINNSINNSSSYRLSSYLDGNKSNPNSYSNYEVSKKTQCELLSDKAYQILNDCEIILNVKYNQSTREAVIEYKKINYRNESGEYADITIDELKIIVSDDEQLNGKYGEFLQFLRKVEEEIKSRYKKTKVTEIQLTFFIVNFENYNMDCK
jgi:hypothetical protein